MAVTENKQLADYFKEVCNSPPRKLREKRSPKEYALIEFVQRQLDKFDWGKEITKGSSSPGFSSFNYGHVTLHPWKADFSLLDNDGQYMKLTFTTEWECEDSEYNENMIAEAIFMKYYGAFVEFTEESVYTNKLKAFCETLGQAEE